MGPIDISTGLHELLASKKRSYPQHVNRVSSLDDPCLRRLYYRRAAWDKAAQTPDSLQSIFETGNLLEPVIGRIVSEVGEASTPRWRIVGQQMPTNDALLKKYQISGSIDGLLQVWDEIWRTVGVIDIKTASPNVYPQLNCYDDLARYHWTRGYRGQLMTYALAHDQDQCFILLVNKSSLYEMKMIHFPLDYQYVEGLLQKAEAVNNAIAANEPPQGISDPTACPRCPFYSYCAPNITTGGNLEIIENDELEAVLSRMDELQDSIGEYYDLEKARDNMLAKGKDIAVGNFLITWKKILVNYKAKPASMTEQYRKTITKL